MEWGGERGFPISRSCFAQSGERRVIQGAQAREGGGGQRQRDK